jgi:hypothetical protein
VKVAENAKRMPMSLLKREAMGMSL